MKDAVLGFVITAWFLPADLSAADPPDLKQTFENYTKAWEKGDAEKMLEFYEPTEEVTAVISSGLTFTGQQELKKMFRLAFEESDFRNVKLPNLKIHQEGDVAWATCRFQAEITLKIAGFEGKKYRFTSQGIFVLRKTKGIWKIASEHFSPIQGVERIQPLDDAKEPQPPVEKGIPTDGRNR